MDNFTKESLAIEVDQQLKGEDVVAVMERLRHQRDLPQRLQTDNGSEFISIVMDRWAYDHSVVMECSRPGKPTGNPSSNRSTAAASGTNASTRNGSFRSTMPARDQARQTEDVLRQALEAARTASATAEREAAVSFPATQRTRADALAQQVEILGDLPAVLRATLADNPKARGAQQQTNVLARRTANVGGWRGCADGTAGVS